MIEQSSAASVDRCECGADADDISFDRSICACGSMHYFCNQCGTQADPCADETPEPPAAYGQHFIVVRGRYVRVPRWLQRRWEFFAARWLGGSHTYSRYPGRI